MLELAAPVLRRFCTLEVNVGPALTIGPSPFGQRRAVPITGGRVSGDQISGTIMPGGHDWQTIGSDGLADYEAHYALETEDGALVEIVDAGLRHGPADVMKRLAAGEHVSPADYYMRSRVRFTTGHPKYAWVNRMLLLGTGARNGAAVQIDLYAVE